MGNSDHGTTYMRVGGDAGALRPWHYIHLTPRPNPRLQCRPREIDGLTVLFVPDDRDCLVCAECA